MYSQIRNFSGLAVLFLAVLFLAWGQPHQARAADVTITPSDLMPTADDTTTSENEAKSAQQKVADKIKDVEAGDTVTFPAGEYDDVGEILITTSGEGSTGKGPITFLGAGMGDGGTTFTGKIMFNVKADNVVIRGFRFKDTETPDKVTVVADNDTGMEGDQPLEYGFPGISILQYLINKGVSGYDTLDPADFTANELDGEMTARRGRVGGLNFELFVSSGTGDDAILINSDTGAEIGQTGGTYDIHNQAVMSAWAKAGLGTIWVDSVVRGSCGEDDDIAGVVIRNNMFMNTELAGVRAGNSPISNRVLLGLNSGADLTWRPPGGAAAARCEVSLDIIGNQFTDVGGNGAFLTMQDGSKVPEIGNRVPAIEIVNSPGSNVRSNKIDGGNWDAVVVLDTPIGSSSAKATINIMRNEITNTLLNGIRIHGGGAFDADNENAKITVSGNQITGVSTSRYLTTAFARANGTGLYRPIMEDAQWESCYGTEAPTSLGRGSIWKRIGAEVIRSARNIFAYTGAPRPLADDSANQLFSVQTDSDTNNDDARLEPTALIRFDGEECYNLGRIKVVRQEGVTISGNDLGYMADGSSDRMLFINAPEYGVVAEGGAPVTLTGNNIGNAREYEVYNYAPGTVTISLTGNYLGERVRNIPGVTGTPATDPITVTGEEERMVGVIANEFMPDEVAPTLSSAMVDGATLTLTYDEPLNEDSEPAATAFNVFAASSSDTDADRTVKKIDDVSVSGSDVVLTLAVAVMDGQMVTVDYMPPDTNPIEDALGGNAAEALSGQAVMNETDAPGDGDDDMPAPAAGGSDGGCALVASSGSGGADMGMLLLPLLLMGLVFGLGREKRSD